MMNFTPTFSRLRARLTPAPPLLEQAAEVIELEPGWTREVPPAISLPGELDRVKCFYGGTEAQVRRLIESVRVELPKLSYRFDDAVLADFTLYIPGNHFVYRSGGKRPVIIGRPDEIEEAQLCTTPVAQTYFGHFLRETLPMELLAAERKLPAICFEREPWLHEPGYRELLDMPARRVRYARVKRLWLVDETSLNSGWANRFGELRRRIRAQVEPTGDTHVFLKRGSLGTATRHLINEFQLVEELERRGFRILEPEKMDAPSLSAALAGSKVVACVEGSVHNHATMAAPPGSALLAIQPPHRFNSVAKLVTDAVGMRFAYVVAEAAGDGFYLDSSRFMQTLELLS